MFTSTVSEYTCEKFDRNTFKCLFSQLPNDTHICTRTHTKRVRETEREIPSLLLVQEIHNEITVKNTLK